MSGVACGLLLLVLVLYPVVKRTRTRWAGRAPREVRIDPARAADGDEAAHASRSRLRPHYRVHLVGGALLAGTAAAHVGRHVAANLAGALTLALGAALATGAFGGLAYFVVPRALSRLERAGHLPEDLAARTRELEERLFRELTGRTDVVKALFARLLAPYVRSPWTSMRLAFGVRSLGDEQRALRAEADRVLQGRGEGRLAGLDDLIKTAVERKAVPAQRALLAVLRGWLVPHIVFSIVALVLAAAHAALALGYL